MKKIYVILLMIGIFSSCTDDLNVVPKDKDEATPNLVFTSVKGYKQVLAKLYAGFSVTGTEGPAGNSDIEGIDEGFGQYLRGYFHHQQLTTDETVVGWNDRTIKDFHDMDWGNGDVFIYAFYSRIFYQIAQCNEFIRESNESVVSGRGFSSADAATIAEFKEEARFIRALCYWHALDVFGGNVPFATENDVLGNIPKATTSDALFSYIESELLAIESTLVAAGANEFGRADQGAAWMLLAKLYLNAKQYINTEKYSDALTYAKKVIDAGYTLEANYAELFMANNHTANGIIFPIRYDGLRTRTWGGTTYLIHAAIGGSMTPSDFGVDAGWAGLRTTSKLVDLFPDPTPVIPSPQTIANTYPKLYVPGDYQGWDPATGDLLLSEASDNNYEGYINFSGGTREFKINTNPDWSVNYGDNGADGSLDAGGSNIVAPADGYYKINVDLTALTYTLTSTSWGLIGDATPGGWSTDTDMTFDATNKVWTVTLDLIGGKDYKFRANDDWAINLGDNGADGTLEYGGANISVAADGNYTVALKLGTSAYTYAINKNEPADSRYMFHTDGQTKVVEDIGEFSYGYAITKWTNKTSSGANGSDLTFPDTDFPMFRLADAYLMYAEAHLRGGGGSAANALTYVNNVRTRAGASTIMAADLDLDFILDERGRELYWECHRRTDLRRFDKFTTSTYLWDWKGGVATGQSVSNHRNIFPIPTQDLTANPNLTQNEGY